MGIGVAQIAEGWDDESSSSLVSGAARPGGSVAIAEVECAAQLLVEALGAFDDGTDLDVLEVVVPLLRRHLDAAEGELARLTADLQHVSCRPETGARSLTQFVARRAGCAQRRVAASLHLGRALAEHPTIADEVRAARVSVDNARLLCEVAGLTAFPAAEAQLLDAARHQTPGRLRHTIDRWLAGIPAETDPATSGGEPADDRDDEIPTGESELERRRRLAFARRAVRMVPLGNGLTRIDAVLPTDMAHAVMARLAELAGISGDDSSGRSWPQRLADALVEMAGVDGLAWSLVHGVSPQMSSRPVVVGIAPDHVISGRRYGGGVSATGEVLDAAQLAEMNCSADRYRLDHDARGAPIDMRRRRRLFLRQQYLALVERDGRCRIGGCEAPPGRCQAHHIDHHAHRGETVVARGVLLCHTHHRWLHRTGARLIGDPAGRMWVETLEGELLPANPPAGGIPAGPTAPRRGGIAIMFPAV
jgi:hypothetical protein